MTSGLTHQISFLIPILEYTLVLKAAGDFLYGYSIQLILHNNLISGHLGTFPHLICGLATLVLDHSIIKGVHNTLYNIMYIKLYILY